MTQQYRGATGAGDDRGAGLAAARRRHRWRSPSTSRAHERPWSRRRSTLRSGWASRDAAARGEQAELRGSPLYGTRLTRGTTRVLAANDELPAPSHGGRDRRRPRQGAANDLTAGPRARGRPTPPARVAVALRPVRMRRRAALRRLAIVSGEGVEHVLSSIFLGAPWTRLPVLRARPLPLAQRLTAVLTSHRAPRSTPGTEATSARQNANAPALSVCPPSRTAARRTHETLPRVDRRRRRGVLQAASATGSAGSASSRLSRNFTSEAMTSVE